MMLRVKRHRPCKGTEPEGRLCALPDHILLLILSFLPILDAVRSCILSRRWRYVYRSLPSLVFICDQFPDAPDKVATFIKCIRHMISDHDKSMVETFKLIFQVNGINFPRFNKKWITYAIKHNVRDFAIAAKLNRVQKIPACLFTCTSLVKLSLDLLSHTFEFPEEVNLPNLKEVVFANFHLNENSPMRNFLLSCPALEILEVKYLIVNCLKFAVETTKLKVLKITSCFGLGYCCVNINTPNLKRFVYKGYVSAEYNVGEMFSLKKASLLFETKGAVLRRNEDQLCYGAMRLFKAFCRATTINLSPWFIELMFSMHCDSWMLANPFCLHIKDLYLHMLGFDGHVCKMISFLDVVPCLQNLYIFGCERDLWIIPAKDWISKIRVCRKNVLNRLQTIKIWWFQSAGNNLLLMTEYLLNNASNLTQMNIIKLEGHRAVTNNKAPENNDAESSTDALIAKLTSFPRVSPSASIVLYKGEPLIGDNVIARI